MDPYTRINNLILYISSFFIYLTCSSLFFISIGKFSYLTVIATVIVFLGIFLKNTRNIYYSPDIKKTILTSFFLTFITTVGFSLYNHQTYFGGRDDGVYANSSLYIAKNGTYKIPNPMVATFPGFNKISEFVIRPQFYLGYSSWLATFITLFGYKSIVISNSVLLFLSLINLFGISFILFGTQSSLVLLLILSTTFPFVWFSRSTFSENLALFLYTVVAHAFIVYQKSKNVDNINTAIVSLALMLCVRVESLLISVSFITLYLFYVVKNKLHGFLNIKHIVTVLASVCLVFGYYYFVDSDYLIETTTKLTNLVSNLIFSASISSSKPGWTNDVNIGKESLEFHLPEITNYLLLKYNFIYYLFLPIILLSVIIKPKFKKIQRYLFTLILLVLPQTYYFINPMIAIDQPWFLRRFYPIIFPTVLILFMTLFYKKTNKILVSGIFVLLFLINILTAKNILFYSEYNGIYDQLEKFTKMPIAPKKDLLLVDYDNTGHYKLAEPLFFIYDFNTAAININLISNRLTYKQDNALSLYSTSALKLPDSICSFNKLFLLTSTLIDPKTKPILDHASLVWETTITYSELKKECEIFRLTPNGLFHEMGHVNYTEVKNYCQNIPNQILDQEIHLQLYEINPDLQSKFYNCRNKT